MGGWVQWIAFGTLALCGSGASLHAQVTFSPNLKAELIDIVDGFHRAEGFSGVVLVSVGDSIVLDRAWGSASLELGVENRPDHRFLLASVSKSFTAAAVLRLVDAGRMSLEAPIVRYLSDADLDPRITVHQLLTHTAGLHRDLLPGTGRTRREHYTTADRLALVAAQGQRFEPGARYAYSSQGYVVLAAAVETVTGVSFAEALRQLVFDPLGMTDTGLELDAALIPRRAERYIDLLGELTPATFEDPSFAYGSGSVSGTARDLLRFARALMGEGFLSADTRAQMLTDHVRGNGYGVRSYEYGTGVRIGRSLGRGVGYDGGTSGVAAVFNIFLDHQTSVIVLGNKTPFQMNRMTNPLNNTALGYPPEPIRHRNPTPFLRVIGTEGVQTALAQIDGLTAADEADQLPNSGELFQTGYGLFQHHRLVEAERVLRFLTEVDPIAPAWSVLGQIYESRDETERACEAFGAARALDPSFAWPTSTACSEPTRTDRRR